MTRTFVQTNEFTHKWEKLGFSDDDLRKLELELLINPLVGPVIRGTGKLRKVRFAFSNSGKRGGVRVCYVDFAPYKVIYLITVYPKNERDNLTKEECSEIKKLIEILEHNLQQGGIFREGCI